MELIETPVFTKKITEILSDSEYSELQWALVANPEAGSLIQGGAGIRKLRWRIPNRGKRGGLRVVYYLYSSEDKIYLLLPYCKSESEGLTKRQVMILAEYVKDGVL